MKKILVFQHVGHEILGNLNPLLKLAGFRIRYVNFDRHPNTKPDLSRYDGLVVLGGPMNVDEVKKYPHLAVEIEAIKTALEREIPILGICLGAQLTAVALGASVGKNAVKEIGWYDVSLTEHGQKDPILKHFEKIEKIFQWHGDTFEIPKGAAHLATSPSCKNQAFRYGKKCYCFQFHLEVDAPMVERWLDIPASLEQMRNAKIDPEGIRKQNHKYIDRSLQLGRKTFSAYIDLFSTKSRQVILGSRH